MGVKQIEVQNDVTVLGWYDQSNIGDEAYKLAFPKIFPNYNFNFKSKLKGNETNVILGGGNVFNDYFISELSKCPNAKKHLMSIDLNNFMNSNLKFENIISRNNSENLNFSSVIPMPDFAFILEENIHNGHKLIKQMFEKQKLELYDKKIIIVMNSFLCVKEEMLARDQLNFDKVCQELATLMDNVDASFILLPFGNGFPHNDRIANSIVYSKCKFWKKIVWFMIILAYKKLLIFVLQPIL